MFDTLLFVQAFECRLCEVGPLPSPHSPVGTWSHRASQRFIQMTENKKLAAKVAFYNFFIISSAIKTISSAIKTISQRVLLRL